MTGDLRLGLNLGHWATPHDATETVRLAERLGYESVWTSETYGSDALTPLAWYGAATTTIGLGALVQVGARTPAAVAMAAMTLDRLSRGRLSLGLGVSNPQVIEGWYGADFRHPLAKTKEQAGLIRQILRRDAPLEHPGPHYPLPTRGGTGLGKAIVLEVRPLRPRIPIYLAASGPANSALAAEVGDGWLAMLFHPERSGPALPGGGSQGRAGFRHRGPGHRGHHPRRARRAAEDQGDDRRLSRRLRGPGPQLPPELRRPPGVPRGGGTRP